MGVRLAKAVAVAVGLWGLAVGLHGLGVPGLRMVRIPLAEGLAPASVQSALDAMTATPKRPDGPAMAGELPMREYRPVKPFADAGPREAIDAVERDLRTDLRIEDREFRPDGRLAADWRAAVREAYTPTGAALEIAATQPSSAGPGPCPREWHVLLDSEGVYVDGSRALALLKERWDCGPHGTAPGRLDHEQYALRLIAGHWRLEGWLDRSPQRIY